MFYVSSIDSSSNTYSVTDTEDNVTEIVSEEQIRGYVQAGIKIGGVSKTGSLIYPVVQSDDTPSGYMYIGHRVGEPEYNCVLRGRWTFSKDLPSSFPKSGVTFRGNSQVCLLYATYIENGVFVDNPVSILDFLDSNWDSPLRKIMLRVYTDSGVEDRIFVCSIEGNTSLRYDFALLSYLNIEEYIADMTKVNNKFSPEVLGRLKHLVYKLERVSDLESIIPLTMQHWDDGEGLVYLSNSYTVPASDLLLRLHKVTYGLVRCDDSNNLLRRSLSIPTRYLENTEQHPVIRVLSKLFFDLEVKSYGGDSFGTSIRFPNVNSVSDAALAKQWDGRVEVYLTPKFSAKERFCVSLYQKRGRLVVDRGGGTVFTHTAREVEHDGTVMFKTLTGNYVVYPDEFLDSVGRGVASKEDSKKLLKTKLLTGNTAITMNAKGEIKGLKPLANGVLILPEGAKIIDSNGLDIIGLTKLVVPRGYKSVKSDAIISQQSYKLGENLIISTETTTSDFMSSLISAMYANSYYLGLELQSRHITFLSETAVVPTMIGMLYSNKMSLPAVKHINLYRGILEFILSATEDERSQAVSYVWDRCLEKGKIGDNISFVNKSMHMPVKEFSIFKYLQIPTKAYTAMVIALRLGKIADSLLVSQSPVFKSYIKRINMICDTMQATALSTLTNAGYITTKGEIHLLRKQGTKVDDMVFGKQDYSIGADDIGW